MMVLNTTHGPQEVPRGTRSPINTTSLLEPPQLQYLDEPPEVVQVLNAAGWAATFEDGHHEELLFWCLLDDETVHGVALDEDGRINLSNNVENNQNFVRYSRGANINDKE
jgi:hypothetical protein